MTLAEDFANWRIERVSIERVESQPILDHDEIVLADRKGWQELKQVMQAKDELPDLPKPPRKNGIVTWAGRDSCWFETAGYLMFGSKCRTDFSAFRTGTYQVYKRRLTVAPHPNRDRCLHPGCSCDINPRSHPSKKTTRRSRSSTGGVLEPGTATPETAGCPFPHRRSANRETVKTLKTRRVSRP